MRCAQWELISSFKSIKFLSSMNMNSIRKLLLVVVVLLCYNVFIIVRAQQMFRNSFSGRNFLMPLQQRRAPIPSTVTISFSSVPSSGFSASPSFVPASGSLSAPSFGGSASSAFGSASSGLRNNVPASSDSSSDSSDITTFNHRIKEDENTVEFETANGIRQKESTIVGSNGEITKSASVSFGTQMAA